MRVLARFVLVILAIVSWPAFGDQTSEIRYRISPNLSDDAEVVWIGVYVGDVNPESDAWSWTSVESNEFSLDIPRTSEDVLIVALRMNFLPIATQLTQEMRNSEVALDFKIGHRFVGKIVSADGIGVANAVLTLERKEDSLRPTPNDAKFEWTTDTVGAFSIGGLAPGNYTIQIGLPCVPRESFNIQVKNGEDIQQDLLLVDAHYIRGRVLDHLGEIVAGAEVSGDLDPPVWKDSFGNVVLGTEMRKSSSSYLEFALSNTLTATSDSNGEFLLGPVVHGQGMNVSATLVNGGTTSTVLVFAGNHNVDLILSRVVPAFGTVIDAMTGEPINEFTMDVHGRQKHEFQHSESHGRISAEIDSSARAIVVRATAYVPFFKTDLVLDSMDEFDLGTVELHPGIYVNGLVFDLESREPVEGARIASLGSGIRENPSSRTYLVSSYMQQRVTARSDAEGKFSLGPIPSGESLLRVDAYHYRSEEVVVESQVATLDIGLTARDVHNTGIVGRIQTNEGEPVAGTVVFHDTNNGGFMFRRTTTYGTIEHFTHSGPYRVHAVSDRGRSKAVDVKVREGDIEEIILVIDPTGRLIGTVTGLERAEGAFATVLSNDRIVQSSGRFSNGDFVLEGIGIGAFTVRIQTTMNRQLLKSFELSNDAAEAHVEIAFTGDSRLFGKIYSLADTNTSRQVRAIGKTGRSLSGWSDILDDGSFEIRGLSDGEYWVEVGKESPWGLGKSDEESRRTRIEVVVSGDTELNFDQAAP